MISLIVLGEFQDFQWSPQVEARAPLGKFVAKDLNLCTSPGLKRQKNLYIPVNTIGTQDKTGFCTQTGAYTQFRSCYTVDLGGGSQEETDASGNMYTYSVNLAEEKLINAALNVVVPSGIKSIDVNGYMNNTSPVGEGYSEIACNSYNVIPYL